MKVKLLFPKNPDDIVELVWQVWHKSRTGINTEMPKFDIDKAYDLFDELTAVDLPLLEFVPLTFLLEDVPVYFREQMVRHKVMSKAGCNFGVDTIPNLVDSTWWSQSMRMLNMGDFAFNKHYYIPEELVNNKDYHDAMLSAQQFYNKLVQDGIPLELARGVLPFACNHTISWSLNLSIFKQISTIRSCWILQTGLWAPILLEMMEELNKLFNHRIKTFALPPCFQKGNFITCKFATENERRLKFLDRLSPCPLHANEYFAPLGLSECDNIHDVLDNMKMIDDGESEYDEEFIIADFYKRAAIYEKLWKCNIFTGDRR